MQMELFCETTVLPHQQYNDGGAIMARTDSRWRREFVASAGILAICVAGQAAAQQTQNVDNSLTEEVIVTGTMIRGVAPVGSPVVGIGEDELSARGATTLTEAVRQIPQIFNLGISDTNFSPANNANANRSGGTAINLRGLSPEATLVLLDSRRLPPAGGGNGSYFDPSVIPSLAIERIEVMADGGSATYGADAVGGVVNMLMRRRYDGAQVQARYGVGDGIDQQSFSGLFGKDWGSGSAWIAADFNHRSPLHAEDRKHYTDDMRPWGGPDLRPTQSNPGTIRVGNTTYAIPAGQDGRNLTPDQLIAGTSNRQSSYEGAYALPEQNRKSVAARIEQDINDRVTVSAQGYYSHRTAPRSTGTVTGTLTVPRSNPFFVHPTDPNAPNVTVEYSYGPDLGPALRKAKVDAYWGSVDATVDLGREWEVTVFGSVGENNERAFFPSMNTAAVNAALADPNPATALNPFGDGTYTNPATLAELLGVLNFNARVRVYEGGFKFDGPLFELPAGEVRMAIGGGYLHTFSVNSTVTSGGGAPNIRTPTISRSRVERDVESGYFEFFVPVSSSDSAIGKLSMSLAGRYDNYSDFGNTFNPKVGLTWQPGAGLTVRGSYGTSYRAPALGDIAVDVQQISVNNFANAASPTGQTRVLWVRGGNDQLDPEEADIYSLGFDWEPDFASGLRLSATYFNIEYTNRIETPGNDTTILNRLDTLGEFVTWNPPAEVINYWLSHPAYAGASQDITQILAMVDGRKVNSGSVTLDGLDLNGTYEFDALGGSWRLGASATHLFKFKRSLSSQSPVINIIDTISNPLSWQGRAYATYRHDAGVSGTLYANYWGDYLNDTVNPVVKVDPWYTFDLNVRYDLPQSDGIFSGMGVTLDVKNVADRAPHYVQNGTLAFDPQVGDIVGRFFVFGVTKKF
jgi:iron complex outermembrane receptor protein